MMRRRLCVLLCCVLFVLSFSTLAFGSSGMSEETVITLMKGAMGDSYDDYDYDIYTKDGNFYFDLATGMVKDDILQVKSAAAETWGNVVESYKNLGTTGLSLLETCGFGDRLFIVRILDDISDGGSDVQLLVVNGAVVYNCYD